MSDEEKVDLSPLDPSRDSQRWEAMVRGVTSRALASHRRRNSVAFQLVAWGRPSLAVAATIALVSWTAVWMTGRGASSRDASVERAPAFQLAEWASTGELPDTARLMSVLGGANGQRE